MERATTPVTRVMINNRGPRASKRKIVSAVTSIIMYVVPVWQDTLGKQWNQERMHSMCRRLAIRVIQAYQSVSLEMVLVLPEMLQRDLLVKQRSEKCNDRNAVEARDELIVHWQERWCSAVTDRWTKRLIPDLESWVNRGHGKVDFWMAQWLTGHGSFNAYLHGRGRCSSSVYQ